MRLRFQVSTGLFKHRLFALIRPVRKFRQLVVNEYIYCRIIDLCAFCYQPVHADSKRQRIIQSVAVQQAGLAQLLQWFANQLTRCYQAFKVLQCVFIEILESSGQADDRQSLVMIGLVQMQHLRQCVHEAARTVDLEYFNQNNAAR